MPNRLNAPRVHDSHTTTGRYSKRLRRDLAEKLAEYREVEESTAEEEGLVHWAIGEFMEAYSQGDMTIDQLYPNILVGLKTLAEAKEKRIRAQYLKERLITPEQLFILFKVVGDILETRISNPEEKMLAAQDIAALIAGQGTVIENPVYKHVALPPTSAVAIIDAAI